ncbi:MAG: TetR/AcrR family transcriptional regulator [Syntrophorhabdaceae bacterium]|nr:TetR/AcrR family transcriptional regulator [Syntrophorhabdaceae bacterium]
MNRRSSKESRQSIIDSALKIFSLHGYAGATMRMIAEDAGISVGGIYLYFKNKDELCLFLIKEKLDEFSKEAEDLFKNIDNPLDAILNYINTSIKYAKKNREFIITQSREQGFTFGIEIKKEFFNRQKALIMEIIQKGIDRGIFVKCNPEEATKVIMGIIRGFILSVVVDPDNLFDPDECCRLILYGLLNRDK